jgi:hypothetical protein
VAIRGTQYMEVEEAYLSTKRADIAPGYGPSGDQEVALLIFSQSIRDTFEAPKRAPRQSTKRASRNWYRSAGDCPGDMESLSAD